MFKVEFDITEPMELYSWFSKRGDTENAGLAISTICQRTLQTPLQVLDQIIMANGNHFDVEMAYRLKAKIQAKEANFTIADELDSILRLIKEARHTSNPAMIRNYTHAAKLMLEKVIEEVQKNERF